MFTSSPPHPQLSIGSLFLDRLLSPTHYPLPMRLYCVRHGESSYNAEGRIQGQSDAPLSELGRRQGAGGVDLVEVLVPAFERATDSGMLDKTLDDNFGARRQWAPGA